MTAITTEWKVINSFRSASGYEAVDTWARITAQDIGRNTSTVEYWVETYLTGTSAAASGTVFKCLDQTNSAGFFTWTSEKQKVLGFSKTYTHDSNGNKSVSGTTSFSSAVSGISGSGSWAIELPHINRIGIITSASSSNKRADGDITVSYTVNKAEYSHSLRLVFSGYSTAVSTSFKLSDLTLNGMNALQFVQRNSVNSKTATLQICCDTKENGTLIGTDTFNLIVAVGSAPTISNFTVTERNLSEAITVKDMSVKDVSATVTASEYATVQSVIVSTGSATATLRKGTGNVWNGTIIGMTSTSDSISYVLTATDGRGYTSSVSKSERYYEYTVPSIQEVSFVRVANPNGTDPSTANTADALGRVEFRVNYTPVLQNSVTAKVTGDLGTKQISGGTDGTFSGTIDLPNADYRRAYEITVEFTDTLGGRVATTPLSIPVAIPIMRMYPRTDTKRAEVDIEGMLFADDVNVTPVADFENKTEFVFEKLPRLAENRYLTGIMYGCTSASASAGFVVLVQIDTNKNVSFANIFNGSGRTFTGTVGGSDLTITASSTVWGGIRLVWNN